MDWYVARFPVLLCVASLLALAVQVGTAGAAPRSNPADRMTAVPIEEPVYDPATRCTKKRRPGVERFAAWLAANARGANWGSYRCEKWGKRKASLHAEGRALDWHLDASERADARSARRLLKLLLAADSAGNEQALARRMGIQEIIWDCGYWSAGMDDFRPYSACVNKRGKRRKRVNPTVAHRDHIHFGMTRRGSMARTSFWDR